jgi:hypothetical protein
MMKFNQLLSSIAAVSALVMGGNAFALDAGTYTVTLEQLKSNGTITGTTAGGASLGLSTTATADANGKISFAFSSAVPTSDSASNPCNFLVTTIKNAAGTTVRKAIAPCTKAGSTASLGVSGVTDKQTDALLAAFLANATDDPIFAVFGFTLVRSGDMSAADITAMSDVGYKGFSNTGGYLDYLKTTRGVTDAQLATFRANIVTQLGSADGYTKLMKDAVDATTTAGSSDNRGKAAGQLLKILVIAAKDVFPEDHILEAFNAMGSITDPLMVARVTAGTLSAQGASMASAAFGPGIMKLRADRSIEKYVAAMTLMGATGTDLSTFTTAAGTLRTAMENAFATLEANFAEDPTKTTASKTAIDAANTSMQSTMTTAFTTFMNSMAASNTRIGTMITNIETALGLSTGASGLQTRFNNGQAFKFYTSGGTATNWPINAVVLTDWFSSTKKAGGSVTYARDTQAIPTAMLWQGVCSNTSHFTKTACQGAGATWTAGRSCYGTVAGTGEVTACQTNPAPYAALLSIQEDVMIREFTRFAAQSAAGSDMGQQKTLEKAYTDGMTTLTSNIGGTTNGTAAISATQKKAIVTMIQSPQF